MYPIARGAGPNHTEVMVESGHGAGECWRRRRRLERQLHDGPAQRIAALTLQLGLLGQKLPASQLVLQRDILDLQDELHAVLQELRSIADQIFPPLLYEAGLGAALGELAERAAGGIRVDASQDRFDPAVEAVAYFAVLEFLDVAGGDGEPIRITVRREHSSLALSVANIDTRCSAAAFEQVGRLGGASEIVDEASPGTIVVRIPCE